MKNKKSKESAGKPRAKKKSAPAQARVEPGSALVGDEITLNIKQIKSVPLSAKFNSYGIQQIEIRGEVLMNKNNFKKY